MKTFNNIGRNKYRDLTALYKIEQKSTEKTAILNNICQYWIISYNIWVYWTKFGNINPFLTVSQVMLNLIMIWLFWNFLFTWLITCTSYRGAFAPKNKNDLCTMKGILFDIGYRTMIRWILFETFKFDLPPQKKMNTNRSVLKWCLSNVQYFLSFFSVEYDLSLTQCPSQSEIVP